MLHMLQGIYTYVSIVCFKCFICFKHMLQVFHWVLQNWIGMLHIYASVSGVFIHILQMFYLDVCIGYTRVYFQFFLVFSSVSDI
jgi:hypothetical protein